MSNNLSPTPDSSNQQPNPPQTVSWREQRRAARVGRRAERFGSSGSAWIGGAILILLGVVSLLQNMGALVSGNWWALFILLPAIGAFGAAWNRWNRNAGQMSAPIIGSLVAGVIFSALSFALFFDFDLTWVGPIALILIGVTTLAVAVLKPKSP
jgi:hypothetical protein